MPVDVRQDRVKITHPNGSSAEILFYGATVISWIQDGIERLFVR